MKPSINDYILQNTFFRLIISLFNNENCSTLSIICMIYKTEFHIFHIGFDFHLLHLEPRIDIEV